MWTIGFLIFFSICSYFFIYSLNYKLYRMDNISELELNKWKNKLSFRDFGNRLWYSFVYTSSVFFQLTLKMEKINFKNKRGTAYLMLVHAIGLICLAYIANFIIQK